MPQLMTPKEAADMLGVSESLVYTWCRNGLLPHYRFGVNGRGGKIMLKEADLQGFVESCRVGEEVPLRYLKPR
jgi:excisionase family DNA binding protein